MTEEEAADDMIARMQSPEGLPDIDIYQFSKEGYPTEMKDFMMQEAEKYKASGYGTMTIGEIAMGWYSAGGTRDGREFETSTYILDTGDEYVKICFWLEGENASGESDKIMTTISAAPQDGE